MEFEFGKYENWEVRDVVDTDRDYAIWLLNRIKKKEKLSDLSAEIEHWLNEIPETIQDPNIIRFGKYEGCHIEHFVYSDKSYCKWLLDKSNLEKEAPETYKILKRLYQVFYIDQKQDIINFYILKFKDKDYVKVGMTSLFILHRIYNYFGGSNFYYDHNIDFSKSFVYKTNDLEIETKVLKDLADCRVDNRTERMNLGLEAIEKHLAKERRKSDGKYFYFKKSLYDFFPFESGEAARKSFRIKLNEFVQFEANYKRNLENLGLLEKYHPEFHSISQFKN